MKKLTAVLVVAAGCVAALVLLAGSGGGGQAASNSQEPADAVPIKGTDLSEVKLTPEAAKRVGIRTAAIEQVAAKGAGGHAATTIPYSAVLYDADGKTFAYTSPRPLVYVRAPIMVADIKGNSVLLSSGPPAGTTVVTVGAPELYGTEFGVEE